MIQTAQIQDQLAVPRTAEAKHAFDNSLGITAVIPLYNGAAFIEQALDSVIAQTLPPVEIVVVDDGSTDDGPGIVARKARVHNITLLRKPNGGQSSARNLGFATARTPLVAMLDQDDIWYPHHLETLIKPFHETRYPELGWVYSNLDQIDREGRMVTRCCLDLAPSIQHPKRSLTGCLATDMFVLPTSSLVRRSAFEAAGGFDERLIGFEDDDLFLRMFRIGYDNVYLNQALAKWRIFSGSASFSSQMGRSRMIYVRKLQETFPPDQEPGALYMRNLLMPRFLPWVIAEYRKAVTSGDAVSLRAAIDDIRVFVPFLSRRARLKMSVMFLVMARPAPARLILKLAGLNIPVIRRFLRFLQPQTG